MLMNKLKTIMVAKLTNLSEENYDKKNYEYRNICTC